MAEIKLLDLNPSRFKVSVYYLGERDKDRWQSHCESIDKIGVSWSQREFMCYGRGTTIEEALTETGRGIDTLIKKWDEERAKMEAKNESNG